MFLQLQHFRDSSIVEAHKLTRHISIVTNSYKQVMILWPLSYPYMSTLQVVLLLTTTVVRRHSLDRARDSSPSSSVSSAVWPAQNQKFSRSYHLVPVRCEQLNRDEQFFLTPTVAIYDMLYIIIKLMDRITYQVTHSFCNLITKLQ